MDYSLEFKVEGVVKGVVERDAAIYCPCPRP
jgi:hypothetical protein